MDQNTRSEAAGPTATQEVADLNDVRLTGRVSGDPEERSMPSGDPLWTFRLVVRRPPAGRVVAGTRRTTVDTVDCAVWGGRARRTVAGLHDGDQVSVDGALRRRFYRAGGAVASRTELEVLHLRVVRRAP